MTLCDRCRGKTIATTCSMFNTEMICLPCKKREEEHPDYEMARKAEDAAVRAGNMNFQGIGLPSELRL